MEKVIVAITTYNLDKYISQALDSVLAQKTCFPFKIIVADDCSSDNTVPILRDYVKRFPDKMVLLTSDRNLGSLANSNRIFDRIDCEYFSFLDGDDYWLTEDRLQKQVDFLDEHQEFSMCGGNTRYLRNGELSEVLIAYQYLGKSYSFDDFINERMPFVHTSSILVRNTIFKNGLPSVFEKAVGTYEECALRGEDFRRILHLQQAPIYVMNEMFSVYRIHDKGIWQGASLLKRMIECSITDRFYSSYFRDLRNTYFKQRSKNSYKSLFEYLIEENLLFPECRLNKKDASLLSDFLRECAAENTVLRNTNKLGRLLRKLVLKIT